MDSFNNNNQYQNFQADGVFGTDLNSLNDTRSAGDRAPFPSDPSHITMSNPLQVLGAPVIGSQLIQARDTGLGRNNELAIIRHAIKYSYSGIYQATKGKISDYLTSYVSEDNEAILLHENERGVFRETALLHLLNSFNNGAQRESNWSRQVFSLVDNGTEKGYNSLFFGNKGTYLNDGTTQLGQMSLTAQELKLITMQTSLLSAAAFIVNYRLVAQMQHALIQKFPNNEGRIRELISRMNRSSYTTTLRTMHSKINTAAFDFNEWNTNVKPLVPASSRNLGSDDSLLVTDIMFYKPATFAVGQLSGENVILSKIIDVDKLIKDSTFFSDVIEYIISEDTSTAADQFLQAQVGFWSGWANLFTKAFLEENQMLEIVQGNGIPLNWQQGWAFEIDRREIIQFDNYRQAYDILQLSGEGGATYDSTTNTYLMRIPYYRKQDGVMMAVQQDQGYYNRWTNQLAQLDLTKPDSMLLSRIISFKLTIYPYVDGGIAFNDIDGDGQAGLTLTYDATEKCYVVVIQTADESSRTKERKVFDNKMKASGVKRKFVTTRDIFAMNDKGINLHLINEMLMFLTQVKVYDKTNDYTMMLNKPEVILMIDKAYAHNIISFKDVYERETTIFPLTKANLS